MKNSIKKLLKGLFITTVTLFAGFGITALTFNLFKTLTSNEMKIFFALDVAILLAVGTVFFLIEDINKKKKKQQQEFEKRHLERVEKSFRSFNGIDMVKIAANSNDYAA